MENNAVKENVDPETDAQVKSLEAIVALSQAIVDAYKSIKVVGALSMFAAFVYAFAVMAGFHGPFIFPVLVFVVVGNQVYVIRTRRKEKKLVEMKNAYESKFGLVAP